MFLNYILGTFFIFSISNSKIDYLDNKLSKIDIYYKDIGLPKNINHIYKNNRKLFIEIIENYLKSNKNIKINFVLAYYYYRKKDFDKAIYHFEKILGKYHLLSDYIYYFLANSYKSKKNLEKAYKFYSLINEDSIFYNEALVNKIKLLIDLKRFLSVKMFFQKNLHYLDNYELSFSYIEALIKLKEYDLVILQLKKMWAHGQIYYQKRIEMLLNRFSKNNKKALISDFENYNRCEYLLQKKEYSYVINSYKLSYSVKKDISFNMDFCILRALVLSGKMKRLNYVNRIRGLFKLKNLERYKLDYLEALFNFNQKKYKKAIKRIKLMLKTYKNYPYNEELHIKLVESYEKLKNHIEKENKMISYIKNNSFNKKRKEYLFELWLENYNIKNYKKSLTYLKLYQKLTPNDLRDDSRSKYYIAKMNKELKNKDYLYNYFELLLNDPLSYYSYLIFIELKKMNLNKKEVKKIIKKIKKKQKKSNEEFEFSYEIEKIYELITIDFKNSAIKELVKFHEKTNEENSLLASAFLFKKLKLYRSSKSIKFKYLKNMMIFPNKSSFIRFWKSFYPLKFASFIYHYSKKFKVDKYFAWGILREESAYNTNAKSSSNAYGLMQLLYPTAKETAQRINLKLNSYKDLYKERINISLGIKYLQVLLKMFKNNKYYAAASYNAGAGNVKAWLRRKSFYNIYDWNENIPVEQTNRYIYKVIGTEHVYNLLYKKNYFKISNVDLFKEVYNEENK